MGQGVLDRSETLALFLAHQNFGRPDPSQFIAQRALRVHLHQTKFARR